MKFTKTVAQALANKVRRIVVDYRCQKIREYKPTEEVQNEIMNDIHTYIAARKAYYEAGTKMRRGLNGFSVYDNDTVETIYQKLVKAMSEQAAPKIPTYDELVDDFLIESLDAENADDLINKVTSKYIE